MKFRKATCIDVPFIVQMLADDTLGSQRERYTDLLPEVYYEAFDQIVEDPH